MTKTIFTDQAKKFTYHAVKFERKLIALYVAPLLSDAEAEAIRSGDYKRELTEGHKPQGRPLLHGPCCPNCGKTFIVEETQMYCANQYCDNLNAYPV